MGVAHIELGSMSLRCLPKKFLKAHKLREQFKLTAADDSYELSVCFCTTLGFCVHAFFVYGKETGHVEAVEAGVA